MGSCVSSSCFGKKSVSVDKKTSPPPPPPLTEGLGKKERNGGGVGGGVEQTVDSVAGSKDENFFDSKVYLDSDCEDDFFSVNGDYTPLGGSTPNNQVVINPNKPTTPRLNKTLIDNVSLSPSENRSPFLSPRKKFAEFLLEASTEQEPGKVEQEQQGLNGKLGEIDGSKSRVDIDGPESRVDIDGPGKPNDSSDKHHSTLHS